MPTWKKVVVSGSNISQLNNDANYLTSATLGQANGFATMSINGTLVLADNPSGSLVFASSSGAGLSIVGTSAPDTITFNLGNIPNTSLSNSSVYITAGSGLTGDGSVSLGGSASLAVGAGTGITVNANDVQLRNAGSLTTNTVLKWDGTQLENSLITDNGTTVTIGGNLTVNGTTITVATENLTVSDKFILLASGSTTNVDGGIIVSNAANNTGSAFYYDGDSQRWSVTPTLASSATSATPNSFLVSVSGSSGDPSGNPLYGAADASRIGAMYVNTSDQSIWIWS